MPLAGISAIGVSNHRARCQFCVQDATFGPVAKQPLKIPALSTGPARRLRRYIGPHSAIRPDLCALICAP